MMSEFIKQIENPILSIHNLSVAYNKGNYAVKNVSAGIKKNRVTAIMGPSGCGKSTLLRAINRMHDLYPNIEINGQLFLMFLFHCKCQFHRIVFLRTYILQYFRHFDF